MTKCKWCGSDGHSSDNCSTKNLVEHLIKEPSGVDKALPSLTVVADEEDVGEAIDEAHFVQHVKKREKTC